MRRIHVGIHAENLRGELRGESGHNEDGYGTDVYIRGDGRRVSTLPCIQPGTVYCIQNNFAYLTRI